MPAAPTRPARISEQSPNFRYTSTPYFQLAFKNASSSYTAGTIELQYYDGDHAKDWVTAGTITVPTNNSTWHAYSFDLRSADLYWVTGFRLWTDNLGVGTYYVDDIVLNSSSAIPEPASLALLGLGGLALLRRRRR